MSISSVIFGCSGPGLSSGEIAFFRDVNPWGFILFARNIENPNQVRRLCKDLRESVGRDALIFIDQEGGRVQRMGAPYWRTAPRANVFEPMFAKNAQVANRACYLNFRLIAEDLRQCGLTANCAPVLDLPVAGADPIVSDRAFSRDRHAMVSLANACMAGLTAGGILPVIKHMPGHGRAKVDSHKALPVIDTKLPILEKSDFYPFRALKQAPVAMTAHVVISEVDASEPVTTSKTAFETIIRDKLGYDGLVVTDDLEMQALRGSLRRRTEKSLHAGCDVVLHCSGNMKSMVEVATALKPLSGRSLERARIAELITQDVEPCDVEALLDEYTRLMRIGLA